MAKSVVKILLSVAGLYKMDRPDRNGEYGCLARNYEMSLACQHPWHKQKPERLRLCPNCHAIGLEHMY